jgi:hypothetical protein
MASGVWASLHKETQIREPRSTVLDGHDRFNRHHMHRLSRRLARPVRRDHELRDRYLAALSVGAAILVCAALIASAIASS